jgi:hypothetical protein
VLRSGGASIGRSERLQESRRLIGPATEKIIIHGRVAAALVCDSPQDRFDHQQAGRKLQR